MAPNAYDALLRGWSGAIWAPGTASTRGRDTSWSFQILLRVTDLALSQNR